MQNPMCSGVYKNLANLVSIFGVLPLLILFDEKNFVYIIPLLIYNNFMDDLDGILAKKLNIASDTGMRLDNVCDAFAHTAFVMVIGMHYGGLCALASLLASTGIIFRIVARLDPKGAPPNGSMTNELMRHTVFILILSQIFEFRPDLYLVVAFALHAATMVAPFPVAYLLRKLTKSAIAVLFLNLLLVVAWLLPNATPYIAASFFFTYLYSIGKGSLEWLRRTDISQIPMADPANASTESE
jgi:phosphatidylglycerophosphate synthase